MVSMDSVVNKEEYAMDVDEHSNIAELDIDGVEEEIIINYPTRNESTSIAIESEFIHNNDEFSTVKNSCNNEQDFRATENTRNDKEDCEMTQKLRNNEEGYEMTLNYDIAKNSCNNEDSNSHNNEEGSETTQNSGNNEKAHESSKNRSANEEGCETTQNYYIAKNICNNEEGSEMTQNSGNNEKARESSKNTSANEEGCETTQNYYVAKNSCNNEEGSEMTQNSGNNEIAHVASNNQRTNEGGYEATGNSRDLEITKNKDYETTNEKGCNINKSPCNVEEGYEIIQSSHSDKEDQKLSQKEGGQTSILNTEVSLTTEENILGEDDHRRVKKQRKSRLKIVDSDSEDDEIDTMSAGDENLGYQETRLGEELNGIKKKSGRTVLFDSDSEDDAANKPKSEENRIGEESTHRKLSSLCDPESSDDDTRADVRKPTKRPALFDSEDEDENSAMPKLDEFSHKVENQVNEGDTNIKKLTALCDSESSEDEVERKSYNMEGDANDQEISSGIKKLTPQEALLQRKEIQSESQRMTRESNASLPYHIPKQRTLKEFLRKRPKFADSMGVHMKKTPAAMSIKLTDKNLEVISKKMEEREKEVEKFFKSESEESEAEDETAGKINSEIKVTAETSQLTVEKNTTDNSDNLPDKNKNQEVTLIPDTIMDFDTPDTNKQIFNDETEDGLKITDELDHKDEAEDKDAANDEDIANSEEPAKDEEHQPALSRRQLLLEKVGNIKPRLSGGPNCIIDFEDNTTKPDEISQLMERFMHHNSRRKSHKNKVQLSIVTVTGAGEIQKEKMSVELHDGESEPTVVETPGEKLQKLRTELQKQISEQRMKLWQQKMANRSNEDEEEADDDLSVYKGEKDSCCGDDDEEASEGEDETECDNKETNDVDVEEDEEDKDEGNENEVDEGDDGDDENDEDHGENEENEESECESENGSEDNCTPITASGKKQLKRIIMNDDSDDDEDGQMVPAGGINISGSTDSWEDQPEPGQKNNELTPKRNKMDSKPELGFLTPVYQLTGLQSLNSGSKFLQESPNSPAFQLPPEPSPLKGWQKKLFSDSDLATQNDSDDESDQNKPSTLNPPEEGHEEPEPEMEPSTQDLLNLCSGKFTGFTQEQTALKLNKPQPFESPKISSDKSFESPATAHGKTNPGNDSGNFTVSASLQIPKIPAASQDATNVDDSDDKLISQILDEDEMEAFKKKFESPVATASQANAVDNPTIAACINFDSDDDESDNDDGVIGAKKKKNLTALIDSEDEADGEDNIDGVDEVSEDEEVEEVLDDEEREVEYDSEENEIEVDKTVNTKKMKIKDFFENEAELSESEWGSADEDENNLDDMEFELGDSEQIDHNKVKRDLEKIHMRQLLDEDKREVKILQELLLEDGELHGAGRVKQFRWKNIDTNNENNDDTTPEKENDDCLLEDEDNEAEWRKKRFEREVFLRKNQKGEGDEAEADIDITASSQVLKLGQKFVLKNRVQVDKTMSEQVPRLTSFAMQTKRGSFLARTDQVLTRVAEYSKESIKLNSAATNKKHFVFQSINVEKSLEVEKKRKASEVGTPQAIKKMRIDKLSPALQKSGNNRLKKLFSNF